MDPISLELQARKSCWPIPGHECSSRNKSAELTWAEIADRNNMVMFDLAGRGTLKLVSQMDKLATRD